MPIAATSINDYVVPSAGGGTGIGIFAPGYLITAPGGYDTLIPMIQKFRAIRYFIEALFEIYHYYA